MRLLGSWALLALALLMGVAAANHTKCNLLANLTTARMPEWEWRSVSLGGRTATVTLVWGSEPAHAAAALLAALLRHVRLYDAVRLPRDPSPLATAVLASSVPFYGAGNYTDLLIGVSTAWAWEPVQQTWEPSAGMAPGLAGPRLAEFGASPVATRRRLHAHLSPHARQLPHCSRHVRWLFYTDRRALADCDFVHEASVQVPAVEVLAVGDCNDMLQQLQKRANTMLSVRRVDRAHFLRTLHTANRSLLFLDYDMWKGAEGVSAVEPPPCVTDDFNCTQELDSTIAIRVADVDILQTYAPQLFQFVYDFKPPPESLRHILERQASGVHIEEAACEWALQTESYIISQQDKEKYDLYKYTVITYLCYGDISNTQYNKIMTLFHKVLSENSKDKCGIVIKRYYTNCSDENHMRSKLYKFTRTSDFYKLVGVVSMAGEGVAEASACAAAARVPLMLAGVAPEDSSAADATWRVAGRPRHIALALRHFVRQSGWTRVAVLSQETKLAADYNTALKHDAEIIFRYFNISAHLKEQQAPAVLQDLRDTNARIVFINTDSTAAITILNAAVAGGMGYSDGFVWIVREPLMDYPDEAVQQDKVVCDTKHFTVSLWSQGVEDLAHAEGWEPLRKELNRTQMLLHAWPPSAVTFSDALVSLVFGFKDLFQQDPRSRQDLHTAQMLRLLEQSLISKSVMGVSQRLKFVERSIEETFVFVDEWCGARFKQRLATWRVNSTSGAVRGNYSRPDLPRDDGASRCLVPTGDAFQPTCLDALLVCALLLVALAPGAAWLARRALRRRLARLRLEQQIQLIARRRHVAAVLAAYLVERTALELREELGAGRFGSVCLARLQQPGCAPRYIAAKALRDNAAAAEESDFLREACTIASLEHAHIVRLVGVCIADGPPLVLMELAFFGDLLGYLRERRHLVDGAGSEEALASGEAEHVSAEALTRLAREAAQALQYLGTRGVVHRDVRAANCLVDERRSLKLADFGMARDTVAGADGAPEYACRRRGLFPVLWMAPESLAHGLFSAASDVWALGVLLLELVTLGARPYGSMSPLRVLEYVASGGSPPLPPAATPQTRGLARLCWARAAERRPLAAQVAAYLAAWPRALSPALPSEHEAPADADSGFGEPPSTELLAPDSPYTELLAPDSPSMELLAPDWPSTELLAPDSPLRSYDQLNSFAVTH